MPPKRPHGDQEVNFDLEDVDIVLMDPERTPIAMSTAELFGNCKVANDETIKATPGFSPARTAG